MKNNLVVNPYIQFFNSGENSENFVLVAPKPQNGLQRLEISKDEHPHLHEVIFDLTQTRFDFLDVERDIDETERGILYDGGMLVEEENVPEKPLFACPLDEVREIEQPEDISALIVNPSFRFEPFNFANFVSWVHEKSLSPHKSSVWIKQPLTEIEAGYWLDNLEAETVARFTAGEHPPVSIAPELLAKLYGAGILTTPDRLAARQEELKARLEEAKIKYERDKYVVLHDLMPPEQMAAMRQYYRKYVGQGFMPFGDGQVKRRFYQHNEPLARFMHTNLAQVMSLIIGEKVIPSYVYAASYLENALLTPHTDRPQCEFSISFQIDYLPEQPGHLSPWALFVWRPDFADGEPISYDEEEFPAESESADQNPRVYLASGDGLIYKGRELIHYRYALPPGHQSTSLFFHYVAEDFDGELQ